MVKRVEKSVVPVYLVAAVWLLSLLFPTVTLPGFFVRTIVWSLAVYWLSKLIFKNKVIEEELPDEPEAPPAPETTGDPALDALIAERDRAISEMRRLNLSIKEETLSGDIDKLERLTGQIIAHVLDHPKKLSQIRKFLSYYLPTTLKLLNAYDRMGAQGVQGENIDGTMDRIEAMMDTIVRAFEKQLDALFGDEALDIQTDITVLENMMVREGFTESPL